MIFLLYISKYYITSRKNGYLTYKRKSTDIMLILSVTKLQLWKRCGALLDRDNPGICDEISDYWEDDLGRTDPDVVQALLLTRQILPKLRSSG